MTSRNIKKTNAARLLDKLGIVYDLIPYEVDPDDLAATHVAAQLGEPIDHVYKTLVLRGDRTGLFVCVIAGDKEVDLKKAARVSGNKKAEMIAMKELLPATGYIRGGCTPLAMKKDYPVFISQDAQPLDRIYVSAGQRGLQLHLTPADLLRASGGEYADIVS